MWGLCFIGIVTTGLSIKAGDLSLSIERTLGLVLIVAMAIDLVSNREGRPAGALTWLWLGWCAVLAVSAVLSGDFVGHLAPLILALVPVGYFWFATAAPIDGGFVDRLARRALWANVIAGAIVLLIKWTIGTAILPEGLVDTMGRLKLWILEPNLLGSTIVFLFFLTLPRARATIATAVLYALTMLVLINTFSKMPFIAFAFALVSYGLLRSAALRTNSAGAIVLPAWLAGLGVIVLLAMLPSAQTFYSNALERGDAIQSRAYTINLALKRFEQSPLLGRGPGDFGMQNVNVLRQIGGQGEKNNLWIWQMMVNIMHDSGIFGLLVYCVFLFGVFNRGLSFIMRGSLDHCGYFCAMLSVFVSSQAASLHLSGIFGIAAGILVLNPTRFYRRVARPKRDTQAIVATV